MTKNSSGYDSLSNRMIKKEPIMFARLLKPLKNESLDLRIFPAWLKTANVIPILKKGDQSNHNNYIPISLIQVLSKVFKKVLNAQLTKVINNGSSWNKILLKIIGRTGLDEKGIEIMANYLKDRKNLVIVNEIKGRYFL